MLEPVAGSPGTGDPLDITVSRPRPGTVVLDVRGEVDTLTAPQFEAALTGLDGGDRSTIVVDLTGVTFLASSGLAVLIQSAHRRDGEADRLRLVAPSRAVRRPLEITGSDQLFDLYNDLDTATRHRD